MEEGESGRRIGRWGLEVEKGENAGGIGGEEVGGP